jgi:hypothetical protein
VNRRLQTQDEEATHVSGLCSFLFKIFVFASRLGAFVVELPGWSPRGEVPDVFPSLNMAGPRMNGRVEGTLFPRT